MRTRCLRQLRIPSALASGAVGVAAAVVAATVVAGPVVASPVVAGTADASVTASSAPSAGGWLSVAAGGSHTCAINTSSRLFCWGENSDGELGTGDTAPRTVPTAVDSDLKWLSVTAGSVDTCAISTNDALWCWGGNGDGQLGTGDLRSSDLPLRVNGDDWDSVSAGGLHTCGIETDGSLWCWGDNTFGQLGIGSSGGPQASPSPVDPQHQWLLVSAGGEHTCAVMDSHGRESFSSPFPFGSLWCWGDNVDGELGVGNFNDSASPDQVGSAGDWLTVSAGGFHTCGIHRPRSAPGRAVGSGVLDCWGYDLHGQLGLGTQTTETSPYQVGSARWDTVTAGNLHTCGTQAKSDTIWCWGWGRFGQLGVGDVKDRHSPTPVQTTMKGWGQVAAADFHTCTLNAQTLWCWGGNMLGQLGLGDTQMRLVPAEVDPG